MTERARPKIMDVVAANGVPFRVTYGHRKYLDGTYTLVPVVSFFDLRYDHTEHGQFVADYLPETLISRNEHYSLNMNGGVESWTVDRWTLRNVCEWLLTHIRQEG